jgi:hypothetical protein
MRKTTAKSTFLKDKKILQYFVSMLARIQNPSCRLQHEESALLKETQEFL